MEQDILQYIKENIPVLNGSLKPVFITDLSRLGIAYSFTDISANHLKESQLTLNVISKSFNECMEMHEKLKTILAMESDEPYVKYGNTFFHSQLSPGGGNLFNPDLQIWEISKYYLIDWRKIN